MQRHAKQPVLGKPTTCSSRPPVLPAPQVRKQRLLRMLYNPAPMPTPFQLFVVGLGLAGVAVGLAWVLVNLDLFLAVQAAFSVAAGAESPIYVARVTPN